MRNAKHGSKHEHFSSGWPPPRNWTWPVPHCDRIRTEILATVREKGILERQDSSGRKILEIDVPIVLYPECGAFWDWASIKNQTRSQVIPTSCNLHIPLPFTVFGSFWVFSPWIFIANPSFAESDAVFDKHLSDATSQHCQNGMGSAHKAFQRYTNEPLLCNAFEVVLIGSQIVRNPAIGWPPIFDTFLLYVLQSTVALLHYLLVQGILWGALFDVLFSSLFVVWCVLWTLFMASLFFCFCDVFVVFISFLRCCFIVCWYSYDFIWWFISWYMGFSERMLNYFSPGQAFQRRKDFVTKPPGCRVVNWDSNSFLLCKFYTKLIYIFYG